MKSLSYPFLLCQLILLCACNPGQRFEVIQETIEQCIIRVNGEFCDESDQFPADISGDWNVEVNEEHTLLYHDEELWVANQISGEREVIKYHETITGNCTNILERHLKITIENDESRNIEVLKGTLEIKSRTEGPSICGATPYGERHRYRLSGEVLNGI